MPFKRFNDLNRVCCMCIVEEAAITGWMSVAHSLGERTWTTSCRVNTQYGPVISSLSLTLFLNTSSGIRSPSSQRFRWNTHVPASSTKPHRKVRSETACGVCVRYDDARRACRFLSSFPSLTAPKQTQPLYHQSMSVRISLLAGWIGTKTDI